MNGSDAFSICRIGRIRSTLRSRADAPRQGYEHAPDAWIDIDPRFTPAFTGMKAGDEIIVITWLHEADRDTLEVHPRGDRNHPLTGVFATRSPDRPNPLGLHRVTVREITASGHSEPQQGIRAEASLVLQPDSSPRLSLRVGPIEAIDGTPVVDIKSTLAKSDDA